MVKLPKRLAPAHGINRLASLSQVVFGRRAHGLTGEAVVLRWADQLAS